MDPLTLAFIGRLVKKYWWVLGLALLLAYVWLLHMKLVSKESTIKTQQALLAVKDIEIARLKKSIETQNKTIDDWTVKGNLQAQRLAQAVSKAQAVKSTTQVTVHEIYTDKTKRLDDLLRHAVSD